jgi:hypothetical protein
MGSILNEIDSHLQLESLTLLKEWQASPRDARRASQPTNENNR